MKYEDVINRIDRYIKSDKYQPIIVDMPNIHLYKKIIEHYDVGCYDIQKASSFCMEEGLPLRGCVIIDYGHLWCTLLLYIV